MIRRSFWSVMKNRINTKGGAYNQGTGWKKKGLEQCNKNQKEKKKRKIITT